MNLLVLFCIGGAIQDGPRNSMTAKLVRSVIHVVTLGYMLNCKVAIAGADILHQIAGADLLRFIWAVAKGARGDTNHGPA